MTGRRIINLLDSIGADLVNADPVEHLPERGLRVEYIPAELIRPDPAQPRRVLPEAIHTAFHSDRLTPAQALRELIQIAQVAARQHGRPFASLIDLLSDSDEEAETETEPQHLSPEEQLVRDLVNLASTIRDDGQVNPLTVVDATQGVTRLYRIETGERRYWATWILREFLPGYEGDGTIPCIIIPSGKASVFRQAKENTARAGLSAIAMARQAALLILTVHGVQKPEGPVGNDFYRQALDLDLRAKREYTADILAAMGGLTKSQFRRCKALLQLADEAIELADRFEVDEFRLRYVLTLPSDDQAEMIRQIVRFNLSGKQVKEMCEQGHSDNPSSPTPSRETMKFVRLIRDIGNTRAEDVALALLQQEKDVHVARARIQRLRQLITEAEQYLSEE